MVSEFESLKWLACACALAAVAGGCSGEKIGTPKSDAIYDDGVGDPGAGGAIDPPMRQDGGSESGVALDAAPASDASSDAASDADASGQDAGTLADASDAAGE